MKNAELILVYLYPKKIEGDIYPGKTVAVGIWVGDGGKPKGGKKVA